MVLFQAGEGRASLDFFGHPGNVNSFSHLHSQLGAIHDVQTKPPLVSTALASVSADNKTGQKQVSGGEGQCISVAVSSDTAQVVSEALLKEQLVKSGPTDTFTWKLNVNHNPALAACAQCLQEKTLHKKSPRVLCQGRLPVRGG